MSSNEVMKPGYQTMKVNQTLPEIIDSHKESIILVLALIVLLIASWKFCHTLVQVCRDYTGLSKVPAFFCFTSSSSSSKMESEAKQSSLFIPQERYQAHTVPSCDVKISENYPLRAPLKVDFNHT